jgi:hypothetical protein
MVYNARMHSVEHFPQMLVNTEFSSVFFVLPASKKTTTIKG